MYTYVVPAPQKTQRVSTSKKLIRDASGNIRCLRTNSS